MATEECVYCGIEGTPWKKVNGHLCYDCHIDSNNKINDRKELEELDNGTEGHYEQADL